MYVSALSDLQISKSFFEPVEFIRKSDEKIVLVDICKTEIKSCDLVYLIDGGKVIKKGTPSEISR